MKFFLLSLAFILISLPVSAQDMLRDHRANDPTAKIFNPDQKAPSTLTDYANLYYDSCTKGSTNKELQDYVKTQCACTSIKMTEFMTLDDMKTLFTKTKEGDFQQARVLMLAYTPCMQQSVHDFVFDSCFFNEEIRKKLQNERKVCECYANGSADYIAGPGYKFIPGFVRNSFNSDQSVPDPFGYIVTSDFFSANTERFFQRCIMTEERHW